MALFSHTPRGTDTCGKQVLISVAGVSFLIGLTCFLRTGLVCPLGKMGPFSLGVNFQLERAHSTANDYTVSRGKVYLGLGQL